MSERFSGSARRPRPVPEVRHLKPYTVPAAGRRDYLRLDFNENTLGPSPRVVDAIRSIPPEEIALYPDETVARAAVAKRFSIDGDLDLVLTSGVDEGIRLVCECFVRPGERILMLEPGYAMYRFYSTLNGSRVEDVTYEDGLRFPERGLRDGMARGCSLLILGDPNNPTGTPVPAGLVGEIATRHPETLVLVDEAYAEFGDGSSLPLLDRHSNLIVARTFSKAYGLAGLRVGVLLGNRETLSWVARMRSPYAVNGPALVALVAALEDDAYMSGYVVEVREARRELVKGLESIGVQSYPSAANFLIARFGETAPAVRRALKKRGVLVRDRSDHPLLQGTLRVGVGTRKHVEACLKAIREALEEVRGGGRP